MPAFPPRLHVLLARDSPWAVVLRRGPSKTVCTLLWDRRTDKFTLGQWMRGRIYEDRCDLSPDGRHLIYFALNGRWRSETGGSWTAVSRAPWLKAETLLAKGDTYYGGGLFIDDRTYWLDEGYLGAHTCLRDLSVMKRDFAWRPPACFGGECTLRYYIRLQRDGWALVQSAPEDRLRHVTTFAKALFGGWTLRKLAHSGIQARPGKGFYWDAHELVHPERGVTINGADWEWADADNGRIVWAAGGRLHAAHLRADGLHEERVLHDFNGMIFEAIEAPY